MDRQFNITFPLLLFLFLAAMLPYLPGMQFDIREGFQLWAIYIHKNGLRNAYGATDYMPLYQYILWLYGKIAGSEQAIIDNIHYLRCFTILFDYLGIWYVYRWIDKKIAFSLLLAIAMLNVSYSYDTLIWGQVDGILSTLVFMTVFFGYKKNNILSSICLILAFNFKIQSIIIVPVWGLLFLSNIRMDKKWTSIFFPVLAAIAVQVILVLPFTMGEYGLHKIISSATGSFNKYPSISIKASNIWHWFVKANDDHGPNTLLYANDAKVWILGLTYKQAGLVMFFMSSFFALLPLMLLLLKGWKKCGGVFMASKELIWLTSALVYLLFYFFNTEIHERYCQPAFIFITAYAFSSGKYLPYVLFSIMYFLTLEISIGHLRLPNYGTLIFDLRFLAGINALIIVYLGLNIYSQYRKVLYSAAGE